MDHGQSSENMDHIRTPAQAKGLNPKSKVVGISIERHMLPADLESGYLGPIEDWFIDLARLNTLANQLDGFSERFPYNHLYWLRELRSA